MGRAALLGRSPRRRAKVERDPMPAHVEPMLAVLSTLPADPENYHFEFKWDGVRAISYVRDGTLRIESRNGIDVTARYPELHPIADAIGHSSAILDGEIVALDDADRPSFARLQRRMHVNNAAAIRMLVGQVPALYVLFDLLYLDGRSLLEQPYWKRRETLTSLTLAGASWQVPPSRVGEGAAMFEAAQRNELEGIVAKRLDSPYLPGRRSPAWRKIKTVQRQEFVIGGWAPEQSGIDGRIGALLLGYYDRAGGLRYAGSLGSGFAAADHQRLHRALSKIERRTNPFAQRLPRTGVRFVDPVLVAEVEYRRWPEGGLVQQAAFKGLRDDKPAKDVRKERPDDPTLECKH